MIDLEDKFFSCPFTANIRPSVRYGHACDSNIRDDTFYHGNNEELEEEKEHSSELIILGGLDS